jgi:hypothetical protein
VSPRKRPAGSTRARIDEGPDRRRRGRGAGEVDVRRAAAPGAGHLGVHADADAASGTHVCRTASGSGHRSHVEDSRQHSDRSKVGLVPAQVWVYLQLDQGGSGHAIDQRGRPFYRTPFISSEDEMVILGVILLVLGLIFKVSVLWYIGIILIVIGAVLFILGSMGRPVAGRRHYW